MKKIMLSLVIIAGLVSCKNQTTGNKFEVSGSISNNSSARMVYLEEIPMTTMERIVVDSVPLGSGGKFKLHADKKEAMVYNLRLDQQTYPFASIINDVPKITVDITFNKENNQVPESYVVRGSDASSKLKDFMLSFYDKLQLLFYADKQLDSLQNINAPDSIKAGIEVTRANNAADIRNLFNSSIARANNPALTMFELGYYQSTANNPGFKLQALNNDEVKKIIDAAAAQFPNHQGIVSIRDTMTADIDRETEQSWVGKQVPEIISTDVNGRQVKLSSLRGKYVLIDFWASWCGPCREENPNVVEAYKKFSNKNFTVFGVSLDRPGEKDKWLAAIKEDNLTWTHVSDLQYWQSPVVALYHFDSIPFNVLIDPEGKVIGEKLRGPELEAKLSEVLK